MKITKESLYLIKYNPSLLSKVPPLIGSITDAIERRIEKGHNCFFCGNIALISYIVEFDLLRSPFLDYGNRWLDLCPSCNQIVIRLNNETSKTI